MKILLVDDHDAWRRTVRRVLLRVPGVEVTEANTEAEATQLAFAQPFDLLLVDLRLSERSDERGGFRLLEQLRAGGCASRFVIIAGTFTAEEVDRDRARARQLGAWGYIEKQDFSAPLLEAFVRTLQSWAAMGDDVRGEDALIGRSPIMLDLRRAIERLADSDQPVLIHGPTGSGKEVVARSLHAKSARRSEPFVTVDCTNLMSTLAQSELFGHEKGAFTSATERKHGLVETASSGTIFLDEIGDLPLEHQGKLLRLLQHRTFRRVGGAAERTTNARFLAATNRDLAAEVRGGRFREDLYYRLSTLRITVPSLGERGAGDGEELLCVLAERCGGDRPDRIPTFTEAAVKDLAKRSWRGNVRELHAVVVRASLRFGDFPIDVRHLPDLVDDGGTDDRERAIDEFLSVCRRMDGGFQAAMDLAFLRAYEQAGRKIVATSELLGMDRWKVRRWLDRIRGTPDGDDRAEGDDVRNRT